MIKDIFQTNNRGEFESFPKMLEDLLAPVDSLPHISNSLKWQCENNDPQINNEFLKR